MTPARNHDPFDSDGQAGTSGGNGRFARFFARVFENPDNPLGWSLKVFTASGIAVRVHLFTIIFVLVELLWSIPQKNIGIGFMAIAMTCLMLLVMLHEFGHCFACRYAGGSADRIVMLPIGGLALCRPPEHWRAHLITTAGGPLVNLAILPLTCVTLWFAGLSSVIVFNPFAASLVLTDPAFHSSSTFLFWVKVALWWAHFVNIVLLGFNVLIPAYPMDGGRLLQSALWSRMGHDRATEVTIYVGFVVSGALGVFGIASNESILVVIAAFSLWTCWVERKRLRGEVELGSSDFALGTALGPAEDLEDPWTIRKRAKQRRALAQEQRELDRILEKINATGMSSLTRREKKTLKIATERKRKADRGG
jgi:Zn-dependent protease